MSAPWLTDPLYGGMSETAARRSYEAWVRQGRRPLPVLPPEPPTREEIDLIERQIAAQFEDIDRDLTAFRKWMDDWRARQPKGFRALRRKTVSRETSAGPITGART